MTEIDYRAQEVLKIVESGYYRKDDGSKVKIKNKLAHGKKNTFHYTNESFNLDYSTLVDYDTKFEVMNKKSTTACKDLMESSEDFDDFNPVGLLNFASGKHPGGGFLRGAKAQEEDLCRNSNLYDCIVDQLSYYDNSDYLNKDDILFTEKVVFFKDENYKNLEKPFCVDVVTSAAPNLNGGKAVNKSVIDKMISKRVENILDTFLLHSNRTIVLGAWGCGAFGNSPEVVAQAFHFWLNGKFKNKFEKVIFAVYDNSDALENFNEFNRVFG